MKNTKSVSGDRAIMATQIAIDRIKTVADRLGQDSLSYLLFRVLSAQEDRGYDNIRDIIERTAMHARSQERRDILRILRELDANESRRTCMSMLIASTKQ